MEYLKEIKDTDIQDIFDSITMIEEKITVESTKKGYNQGFEDAFTDDNNLIEGFSVGVDVSSKLAAEIGYYWGFATVWLAQHNNNSFQKKAKVLHDLRDMSDKLITMNTEGEEWHQHLANIRAKYKQAESLLKLKPTVSEKQDTFSF